MPSFIGKNTVLEAYGHASKSAGEIAPTFKRLNFLLQVLPQSKRDWLQFVLVGLCVARSDSMDYHTEVFPRAVEVATNASKFSCTTLTSRRCSFSDTGRFILSILRELAELSRLALSVPVLPQYAQELR